MINKSVLAAVALALSTALVSPAFAARVHEYRHAAPNGLYNYDPGWAPQTRFGNPGYDPNYGNSASGPSNEW